MKNLKTATVIASAFLLAAPAFAQTTTPAAPTAPATTTAPAAPATTTAPAATTGFVAPEGYSLLSDWAAVTADQLKGVDIKGPEGSSIGEISDVELSTDGKVSGLIANIGGFLGMGTHTVKLGLDQVSLYANADKDLVAHSSLTKDALKALPEHVAAK